MSKETTNQGYIDALAYATDPDNVDTPDQQHNEYERGIKSYGLSQDGESAALNSLLFSDTVNSRVGINTIPDSELDVEGRTAGGLVGSIKIRSQNNASLVTLEAVDLDTDGSSEFRIYTRNGGSITERMRFLSSGGFTLNGGTLPNEALDYYEVGLFTPTLPNIGTGTYNAQDGRYVRVGDMVTCQVKISMATLGTASGDLEIAGLPFTSSTADHTSGSLYGENFGTARGDLVGLLGASATNMFFYYGSASVGSPNRVTHGDFGGTGNLIFSITYQVA